jgi:CheY-like chemotaxis protein
MARILTIDDDHSVRETLVKELTALGHTVIAASDGRQGLQRAFYRQIDVILLDMIMPGMTGLEVLRRLKNSLRTQHLPVIVLTGHDDYDLKDQAYYDYAEDFIMKSASLREINDRIMSVLARARPAPAGLPSLCRW